MNGHRQTAPAGPFRANNGSCRQCAIDFTRAPQNFRNGGFDVSFLAVSGIQMIYLATFVELPNEPVLD
jgi:hypothetical protein